MAAVVTRPPAPGTVFDDLRSFIAACQEVDNWHLIEGAHWDQEIGALTEAVAELIPEPPLLIFDNIQDYPKGFRVVSLLYASTKRAALSLGLPTDRPKLELTRLAAKKVQNAQPIPPSYTQNAPVMQNSLLNDAVDLWKFPAPRFHAEDGGRYIGTGDIIIQRDPDSGFINLGTYRLQVHELNLLGIWMSPGQHGRLICQRYWQQGKSCPVVATFGGDPLLFMASHTKIPWGLSELDFAGGLRGRPVEVIPGPITGLPIPAHAEIAIEGEIPPPDTLARNEGPFGEWPGYYSGGTIGTGKPQPVIQVKAIYYRDNPIIENQAPMWPGAAKYAIPVMAGLLWDQLEKAGVQDVVGVYSYTSYLTVVAIRQRYPGHAKQAAHAVLGCSSAARNGRYIVIVDEDIDPTNLKEVIWAMQTRVDPTTDIELVDGCWSTPLDPRMPPDKRNSGDHTNSRAIFYAVRPWHWRDQFPKVSRSPKHLRQQIIQKYQHLFPFPPTL